MVYGFKIVQDLMRRPVQLHGRARATRSVERHASARPCRSIIDWNQLNLNHIDKAVIDQDLCIQCGRCHVVCEDTSHQAITATKNGKRHFEVIDEECVGCNLCVSICPVPGCITHAGARSRARWTSAPAWW